MNKDVVTLDSWLVERFARNGYIRRPNVERRKQEKTHYKKGWEVRLVLRSDSELKRSVRIAARSGIRPGKPFRKANQWVLPMYGKPAVDAFLNAGAP